MEIFLCLAVSLLFLFRPSTGQGLVGVSLRATNHYIEQGKTIELINMMKIPRVRVIDPTTEFISSLIGSGVIVSLSVEDEDTLTLIGTNKTAACDYVRNLIASSGRSVNISSISIGDEIIVKKPKLIKTVLKGVENVRESLEGLGLPGVVVSTSHSYDMIDGVFPPSASTFSPKYLSEITTALKILNRTNTPFQIELYPYEIYKAGKVAEANIKYTMFEVDVKDESIYIDPATGLRYASVLDMMIDSTFSALAKAGYGNMGLEITGTGWPNWNPDIDGLTTEENDFMSGEYNQRVINFVNSRPGTPLRPYESISVYLNGLVNDDPVEASSETAITYRSFMGIVTNYFKHRYNMNWSVVKVPPVIGGGAAGPSATFFLCFFLSIFFFFLLL
ncbi:Beta-1,3-endoglucanase, family GH17 [Zostera marina]|uniref:Beta-1,3-endoglucanase, family GH17 n=1 Tax=Zostera marina TaxID=29655 RepID=A0A0K9NPW9_ZOSMR|nr:Beta-1,3-endoglucanase, family GH17 [Zostera marina]